MDKHQLIARLQLQPHLEGGYFRRSYGAALSTTIPGGGTRPLMSSIYYLLTDDSPIGYFHRNRSDIMHYWQGGSALRYYLIDPHGELSSSVLGPDLERGEVLQLLVSGNTWKATELCDGEYGLLSEAVSPGFDYADMALATTAALRTAFPELWSQQQDLLSRLCKPA